MNEQQLVEAAQEDPQQFAELYDIHFERIYAFVARRVGRREAAEDVTSEVFRQALANIGKFEWRGAPFSAWLFRIAANAVVDYFRTNRPTEEWSDAAAPEKAGSEDIEQQAVLFRLVEDLPADQRRVVQMRFAEQKSIREIAEALQRTDGAVKQLQLRALKNLRARMRKTHA